MLKIHPVLRDESGAALVIALIMMILLTLIGLASTFSSTFEIKLSGNKRGSTNAFYTADGGVQSTVANLGNFNLATGYSAVDSSTLTPDLQKESINSKNISPTLTLPTGVSFSDPPGVTIYHSTNSNAPRGLGFSATGNIEYTYYIVDSVGRDQTDTGALKSNSHLREKVIRLVPTSQGGN